MKKLVLLLGMLCQGILLTAQSDWGLREYRTLFWNQVAASCATPVQWEKSVEELGESPEFSKEIHVYTVDCNRGQAVNIENGEVAHLKFSEFSTLFEFDFANPYLADYLEIRRDGAGIHVNIRAGQEAETPLHKQVFEVDAQSGTLRYAEVSVVKKNWLYDSEIHTKVWFDEGGQYLRHETETLTAVALSGRVHTRILGRRRA